MALAKKTAPATKRITPKASDPITYLLTMKSGKQQRITIPGNWKVTFGPLVPGGKGFEGNGRASICLRLYESTDRQRAVFTEVESFRDISIQVEERVTKTQRETFQKQTPEGAKDFVCEAVMHEWVDPDSPREVPAEFLKLDHK